jgi:drug/metabolite transporter (DMT)-like permease
MSRRAWVLFTAMSILWGLPYLLIKVAVGELEPTLIVFVRLMLAALVLLPLAFARRSLSGARNDWRPLLAIATIGIVGPFLLIAYGEQHITSSLTALLIAADPLFIVLLALRFDPSERASGTRLVGLCLGLVGVAALLGLSLGGDALGVLGAAMVLAAAFGYAISALVVKRLTHISPLGATVVTLTIAAVVLAPPALASLPDHLPSPAAIGSVVVLGTVCTALAYVIYFDLIVTAGATRASLITYVNPAVAVILGVLILGEPVTLGTIAGFALIIAGCALSTGLGVGWRDRRARRALRFPGATRTWRAGWWP